MENHLTGIEDTLMEWLCENPERNEAYTEYLDIWNAVAIRRKSEDYNRNIAWDTIKKQIRVKEEERLKKRNRAIIYLSIAASIASLIAIGTNRSLDRSVNRKNITYQEMHVPYGSRSEITLPDGTQVWLNAGTSIRYSNAYNLDNREVWMEGECYFKVTPGMDMPFVVDAPGLRVVALGTEFNIKAYPEEKSVETTLVQGRIEVLTSAREKENKKRIVLTSGQTAFFDKISTLMPPGRNAPDPESRFDESPFDEVITDIKEIRNNPSPELQTSWKEGKLIAQKERLSSLARKLERRYNVTIEFADTSSENYIFSGVLVNETMEQVLHIIRLTSPVQYSVEGSVITIQEDKELRKRLR